MGRLIQLLNAILEGRKEMPDNNPVVVPRSMEFQRAAAPPYPHGFKDSWTQGANSLKSALENVDAAVAHVDAKKADHQAAKEKSAQAKAEELSAASAVSDAHDQVAAAKANAKAVARAQHQLLANFLASDTPGDWEPVDTPPEPPNGPSGPVPAAELSPSLHGAE